MNNERGNWKDITLEDASDSELDLVHMIFGPRPKWMDAVNWRNNMRACANIIRSHYSTELRDTKTREMVARQAAIAAEKRLVPAKEALLEILADFSKNGESHANYSDGEYTQDYTTRKERLQNALR